MKTHTLWAMMMASLSIMPALAQTASDASSALPARGQGSAEPHPLKAGKMFQDCKECPEMVEISAGVFEMGSEKGAAERPKHIVKIARPFAIGKYEVTQGQWRAVMGNNPSHFSACGDACPVEKVSWDDVQEFIRKLNAKTGKQYRLPSESEWEAACRAGGKHEHCGGDQAGDVAWHSGNSGRSTHPVGKKQPNAFGLYDMSGNVWEWVEDCYHNNYLGAPDNGSAWTNGRCGRRTLRGGSWYYSAQEARASARDSSSPLSRDSSDGFRLARNMN